MSKINIKELKELFSKATPGPWGLEHEDTMIADFSGSRPGDWDWIVGEMNEEDSENIENNNRLIVAMHEAIPDLISWIEKTTEALREVPVEHLHGEHVYICRDDCPGCDWEATYRPKDAES